DITGFGLLGHLLEMLGAGGAAELRLDAIPLLPGVAALLQAGVASSMHAANVGAAGGILRVAPGLDARLAQILYDPQTSGGLLVSVPGDRAQALCNALRAAGYDRSAIIGTRTAPDPESDWRVSLR
ncbi:MAG: selenide, water dikinase, partial [Halioglobus sp.]|nr:selenide, water dikinase [Halioglobus sp.]